MKYQKLLQYIKPYQLRIVAALFCMTVTSLCTAASMWFIKITIDNVFLSHNHRLLLYLTFSLPIFYFFKGIFVYGQGYLMYYVGQKATADLRETLFTHIHRLSLDFYTRHSTARITAHLTNDVNTIQLALIHVPTTLVRDGLTILFLIGLLFYLHWQFALIVLIAFPIASLPLAKFTYKMRIASREGQKRMENLYARIQESIMGTTIVKVYNQEEHEINRFQRENHNFVRAIMKFTQVDALATPVMEVIGSLAIAFIIWYGGRDVINGSWTTGDFFSFFGASLSVYQPLKNFAHLNSYIQQAIAAAERIFRIMDTPPSITVSENSTQVTQFKQQIRYDNVWFAYPSSPAGENTPWVLQNINLTIDRGQVVALVGHSGAGKTSLSYLLPRFYDPQEGKILFDGIDLRTLDLKSLRLKIGMVTQDIILFDETIKYNIAYAKPTASENEIISAAQVANAHQFIINLAQGYNTVIGERGVRLSGGEKQRIAIARAILTNPGILILDEATSALDMVSEKLIQEAIVRLMENRTTLVIAHRLATVRRADKIIVMEQGKITETGTHEQLLTKSSLYQKYCQLQIWD